MPMKKIFTFAMLCVLTACSYESYDNFMQTRKNFFSKWQTESIDYYIDSEETDGSLVNVEEVTYEDVERGITTTTPVGGVMASSQTDVFNTVEKEVLRANKSAVLSSSYSPVYIRRGDIFNAFGEVTLEGKRYMLVRHEDNGDILIIDGEGKVSHRIGRLVGGRLAILSNYFFVEPNDVRILPYLQSETKPNERIDSFELFYNGLDGNDMTFSYVHNGQESNVETFSFPVSDQYIEINNLKIDVLNADKNKITYIIR